MKKYQEIRHRYEDVVAGAADYQMFRDIRSLLAYIETLHQTMARQAAEKAVRTIQLAWENEPSHEVH